MPRSAALLAGAAWLLAAPLAAQVGLASAPRSITLTATRLPSVSVALPHGAMASLSGSLASGAAGLAPVPVSTSWNVNPTEPVAVTLVAYFELPPGAATSRALFTQAISAVNARSGRTDDVPARPAGILNLVAITQ